MNATGRNRQRDLPQALDMGLVDEIQLHVAPLLLGQGIRLFETLHSGNVQLETVDVAAGELIDLCFRVAKQGTRHTSHR